MPKVKRPEASREVPAPAETDDELQVVFDEPEARPRRVSMTGEQPVPPELDFDLESVLEEIDALDLDPDDAFLSGDRDINNQQASETAKLNRAVQPASAKTMPRTAPKPTVAAKPPTNGKRPESPASAASPVRRVSTAGQKPAVKAATDGRNRAAAKANNDAGAVGALARPVPSPASPAALGYEVLPDDVPDAATPAVVAGEPGYDVVLDEDPKATSHGGRRRRLWKFVAGLVLAGALAGVSLLVVDRALQADSSASQPMVRQYEAARQRAAGRRQAGNVVSAERPVETPKVEDKPGTSPPTAEPPSAADGRIEIGIAYGTEKRNWLEWAAGQFVDTDDGSRIRVNLLPMDSLESAHAILDGDERIHVWSPASSLYRETLLHAWEAKHEGQPILKEETLALTPLVLVMWKDRYDAYAARCPEVSLRTFSYAMHAKQGWATIAGRPQWGRFKFGHTHPNQSNSGLMTLLVLAYEYTGKTAGLTLSDIMTPEFQDHLTRFGTGVVGLSNSTDNLMKDMTLKGPSSYDALLVYESVAIDYLEDAKERWGPLQVIYPRSNLWNDNPYCILNTPWTTTEHQQAAETFLKFLLSPPIQERALNHGFRPGNPSVPVNGDQSPFVRFAECGLRVEIPEVCEVPSREVLQNLQQAWIRLAMPRSQGQR
ncbi:MAG: extracellular solute-binding protein [Planctomycetota bacterium]|nr:extracellular solute-binding protein [Planctomycetota bacterium]